MKNQKVKRKILIGALAFAGLFMSATSFAAIWHCKSTDSVSNVGGVGSVSHPYWGIASLANVNNPRQVAINRSFNKCKNKSASPASCSFIKCERPVVVRPLWRCSFYNRRGFHFVRRRVGRGFARRAALNACYNFPSRYCHINRCVKLG